MIGDDVGQEKGAGSGDGSKADEVGPGVKLEGMLAALVGGDIGE